MTINWGWKIAAGYTGFATLIICLVIASSHQKIDLVSPDYYKDEIAYQNVLDASRNQANLAGTLSIHANSKEVVIEFPTEFNKKIVTGNVIFYSAANKDWDKNVSINTGDNKIVIPRSDLRPTIYQIKISYTVDGKNFYYQTEIDLHNT